MPTIKEKYPYSIKDLKQLTGLSERGINWLLANKKKVLDVEVDFVKGDGKTSPYRIAKKSYDEIRSKLL